MKRNEKLFIVAVVLFAGLFIALSTWHARPAPDAHALPAAGGLARDLDAGRIQRLIRDNRLSDHKALYYRPAPETPQPPEPEPADRPPIPR